METQHNSIIRRVCSHTGQAKSFELRAPSSEELCGAPHLSRACPLGGGDKVALLPTAPSQVRALERGGGGGGGGGGEEEEEGRGRGKRKGRGRAKRKGRGRGRGRGRGVSHEDHSTVALKRRASARGREASSPGQTGGRAHRPHPTLPPPPPPPPAVPPPPPPPPRLRLSGGRRERLSQAVALATGSCACDRQLCL